MPGPTAPTPIAAAPLAPDKNDRATFNARAYAWAAWQKDHLQPEGDALAQNVYDNATIAYNSGQTATAASNTAQAAQTAAVATANAAMWVSGTNYALGANAISPINFVTYRRKVAGAGATDPSADPANWAPVALAAPDVQNQSATSFTTAGTATAYTGVPNPALTAYAAGQSFWVTFHAASGDDPTLQISGLAAPPTLVKMAAGGGYSNIKSSEIPANHRSRVTLLSAAQALVEELPVQSGASDFPPNTFSASFGIVWGHRGTLFIHPASDVTARTITIPANAAMALPLGFTFTVANENGAGAVSIAITTDTLLMAGTGQTGTRTLAAGGMASFVKITATKWMASGNLT